MLMVAQLLKRMMVASGVHLSRWAAVRRSKMHTCGSGQTLVGGPAGQWLAQWGNLRGAGTRRYREWRRKQALAGCGAATSWARGVCWRRVGVPGPRRRHPGTDRGTPGHRLSLKWRARRVGAWSSRECQDRKAWMAGEGHWRLHQHQQHHHRRARCPESSRR